MEASSCRLEHLMLMSSMELWVKSVSLPPSWSLLRGLKVLMWHGSAITTCLHFHFFPSEGSWNKNTELLSQTSPFLTSEQAAISGPNETIHRKRYLLSSQHLFILFLSAILTSWRDSGERKFWFTTNWTGNVVTLTGKPWLQGQISRWYFIILFFWL